MDKEIARINRVVITMGDTRDAEKNSPYDSCWIQKTSAASWRYNGCSRKRCSETLRPHFRMRSNISTGCDTWYSDA